jgi:hypothetical protein
VLAGGVEASERHALTFSAYAYMPGFSFESYAAEQMAQSIELGEAAIISHAAAVPMNAVDPDTVKALATTAFADRRMTGIKI